jgi:hypothetical protein
VTERPVRHGRLDARHIKSSLSVSYRAYCSNTTDEHKLQGRLDKAVVVSAKPCAVKVARTV